MASSKQVALLLGLLHLLLAGRPAIAAFDYGEALTKSLLYFEAQRSGKLPPNQRVTWRGDSALHDGNDAGVDLTGGYYDAGDNVKFGLPMAYSVTMLSWAVVDFASRLAAKNELEHALDAVKWGTDYLLKANVAPDVLYVQVGDGNADHECWQRPEDMTTPRTSYRVDASNPGSDVAAETAAALAAASIAFSRVQPDYAATLLTHAKQLLDFARNHRGTFSNQFYHSSGDEDEISWAAAWLYRATGDNAYLTIMWSGNNGGVRTAFSWDDKFVGVQALISKVIYIYQLFIVQGAIQNSGAWATYKYNLDMFICNVAQKGSNNIRKTPGGLLNFLPWSDNQYVTSAMFILASHADQVLGASGATLQCPQGTVTSQDLINVVYSQVDYILGANPKKISYMVGFGSYYPVKVHHRGASIVSIKQSPTPIDCKGGFSWLNSDAPNPNLIDGAIASPDESDAFADSRNDYQHNEPSTVVVAPIVGVLARLA
ncbi:hypothetical protein Cni_G10626 [Canna indica]|uniref:Endoglucanase n=1 Tax=Canna indica TaxID=4628 RepID=A0AAQ3K7Z7_9LILI|nr:hypothetical protein Cni_G10626 [Canna indica]